MTKTKMLDFIEKTGMVINFDRKYLMKKNREFIEELYDMAIIYAQKKKCELLSSSFFLDVERLKYSLTFSKKYAII